MAIKLDKVVPFGRSLDEYRRMFDLSDGDLCKPMIGVGDGPASFNAETFAMGNTVISVDPLYAFRADEIQQQFYAVVDDIIAQVEATPHDWTWSYHKSPKQLKENRTSVLSRFVADYEQVKAEGRYVVGELPRLDFVDEQFQLAVCSHFLFLYSDKLTYEFHREAVFEMLRVAAEVRIFPLLMLSRKPSEYVQPLIEELRSKGVVASIENVDYELQKGGNKMLRIRKASATIS